MDDPETELRYHPRTSDPLFLAAHEFVERHEHRADGYVHGVAFWHSWMIRQAFWLGAKWAREQKGHTT